MDPRQRIVLAFVERLILNESGADFDGWCQEHLEDVAKALEQVDQPGAASLLRLRWKRSQEAALPKAEVPLTYEEVERTRILGTDGPHGSSQG